MPKKTNDDQHTESIVDRKIGVIIEHMNDQFERVIEAVQSVRDTTKVIPKMSERIESVEYEVRIVRLAASSASDGTKLLKIRSEKILEELEDINRQLSIHDSRISKLEAA